MNQSSKSRDTKDNKYWIQMLINEENGKALTKAINHKDTKIEEITWHSPLKELQYMQYRLYQEEIYEKLKLEKEDVETLPMNQPLWDAIGTSGDKIILVEGDNSYHLIENSLAYLNKLRSRGYKAKLILLNIINNQTIIPRYDYDNNLNYKKVFIDMYGRMETPRDVVVLDYLIK